MHVWRTLSAFGAAGFAAIAATQALAAGSPKGVWLNDTGRGAVEIKDCGGALCGHVVWVKDGADAKGCGKQIIGDARPAGSTRWDNGWIYSPEKKKRYDVELTPLGEDKLRVVGYAGVKLFSKTMVWKRAPGDLQRCGTLEAAPKPESSKSVVEAAAKVAESKTAEVKQPQPPQAKTEPPMDIRQAVKSATLPDKPKAEAAPPAPVADAPAPAKPAAEPELKAEADPAPSDTDDESAPASESSPSIGGLNLGDLDLGKVLTRTKGGNCKLDLPWVKIEIGCE